MTTTVNRRIAIKAAIAYSAAFAGAKAFAFNPFGRNGEKQDTPSQRRTQMDEVTSQYPPLLADDLKRNLTRAQIDEDKTLPHIGLVGDPGLFLAMLGETLFNSFIYRSYGSAIASGKSPGARSGLQLPLKDVELTLGEANALGALTPFARVLQEQLQFANGQGLGLEDWSVALASVARMRSATVAAA
jgi:hypothetical protein